MSLNHHEISIVKGMLLRGDKQHDIAAYFGVNGGRIAEINTGQNEDAAAVEPADETGLPPAGPVMAGRSALRLLNDLHALRDMIDDTIIAVQNFEQGGR